MSYYEHNGMKPIKSVSDFTDLEAAKLLLDSWKFRQAHAWSILTRYYFAAVIVSVAPYVVKNDLAKQIPLAMQALPVIGGLLSLAAIWLYAAEHIRAQPMNHGFRSLLAKHGYYKITPLGSFKKIVFKPRIGWTTINVLVLASISLAIVNFIIVQNLVNTLLR